MLDTQEMIKFIKSLFIFYKGKSKIVEGSFSVKSIPLQSMVSPKVFYEFALITNMNGTVIGATVSLCYLVKEDDMKRVEMIYTNGYVVEGNWVNDLENIIKCQQIKIGETRKRKFINILESNKLIEEPYVDDDSMMSEVNDLLKG